MATTFGAASTDKVNYGNRTPLNDLATFTYLAWVRATTLTTAVRIIQKGLAGTAPAGFKILELNGTTGNLQLSIARATTQLDYITSNTPLAVNTWTMVACTYDDAAGTPGHIYAGTATTPAVEATYSTTNAGSGTVKGDNGEGFILGNRSSGGFAFQGDIAVVAVINRVLTLGEILLFQETTRALSGGVLLSFPGKDGPLTALDYSGNLNHGNISGPILALDPPRLHVRV